MPRTKVIAKKDLLPFFKKGDKVTIVPILYEEDTLIRNEIYGVFKDDVLIKFFEKADYSRCGKDLEIKKVEEKLYAPKGSYKDSVIEIEDGRQYPSSLVRRYEDYFEKVDW